MKRRPLLRRLGAVLLSSLLGLGILEIALRTLPLKRASTLANEVYTAYGSFPGGIYFTEPETQINFMVPGFETENFWNGYSWRHRADGLGFRNPPGLKDRSLLLLGDSLIYGHGVEEEQTVAHLLRTQEGRPAYNMARQGDCLYQQYVLLRLYSDELAPRKVMLFVFLNDFADLFFYRTREEIERMPELRLDGRALRQRVADLGRNPRYPPRRQLYRSRSLRLLRGAAKSLSSGDWMAQAEAAPAGEEDLAAAVLQPEPFALASRYYRRVLGECQRLAADKGAGLQVVLLDVGAGAGSDGRLAYERHRRRSAPVKPGQPRSRIRKTGRCLMPATAGIAGLFYDSRARRLGPLLRGHFLLFDRKEAPTYPSATGLRLLAIFVVLELVVGPRFALFSWLGLSPPPAGPQVALLLAASVLAARFWARASFSDIGFLPWRKWTLTERLYFPQVVLLANAVFLTLFYPKISLLAGHPDAWPAAAAFAAGQLLWGFYQELNYCGILQTELTRRLGRIWGPLAANVFYTFGPLHFYHFTSDRSRASIATVFAATFSIGLVFAFIFHRTRNLWLVGIFHGIGNVYINGANHIESLLS